MPSSFGLQCLPIFFLDILELLRHFLAYFRALSYSGKYVRKWVGSQTDAPKPLHVALALAKQDRQKKLPEEGHDGPIRTSSLESNSSFTSKEFSPSSQRESHRNWLRGVSRGRPKKGVNMIIIEKDRKRELVGKYRFFCSGYPELLFLGSMKVGGEAILH